MRNQRGYILSCAVALLFVAGTLEPVIASEGRADSGAVLPAESSVALAHGLRAAFQALPKPPNVLFRLAHTVMTRTLPEQGKSVPEGLQKVEIWYDSSVRDNFVTLAVINAAGDRIDKRDAAIDPADQTHVTASVPALVPGSYTARYRAISVDGFLASGSWVFEVQPKVASLNR